MHTKSQWLVSERKALENAFFLKEDQKLIARLRAMKKMEESRKALTEVSGVVNERVLNKLIELDIRPETVVSLRLIPLIEVAWADGRISTRERMAISDSVRQAGMNELNQELVAAWLTHRPEPRLLDAWVHYIQGLCEKLTDSEINNLRKKIMGEAEAIAKSAGGFLGLGSISAKEKAMLKKLEEAFVLKPHLLE